MTNPPTPAELAAWRELDQKRTPGEWTIVRPEPNECLMYSVTADGLSGHTLADCFCCPEEQDEANAAFIAAASTAVPRLLDAVDALTLRVAELEKAGKSLLAIYDRINSGGRIVGGVMHDELGDVMAARQTLHPSRKEDNNEL